MPDLKGIRAEYKAARPSRAVIRPAPPEGISAQYGTLGAALDHRLRCAFSDQFHDSGAIAAGISLIAHPRFGLPPATGQAAATAGVELLGAIHDCIETARPHDRSQPIPLPDTDEESLARLCYAAVWFEELYRSGRVWPGTPLGDADPSLSLAGLLAAVPRYAVDDLAAQVTLADAALGQLRSRTTTDAVTLGPTFTGSPDVGGAEADVIIDGLLLDV